MHEMEANSMRLMRLAITSTFLVAVQALGGAAAGFAPGWGSAPKRSHHKHTAETRKQQ
jgi:hypothetical protein